MSSIETASSLSSTASSSGGRNYKKIFILFFVLLFSGFSLVYLNKVRQIMNQYKIQTFWNTYGTVNLNNINSDDDLNNINSDSYQFLNSEFKNSFGKVKKNMNKFTQALIGSAIHETNDCKIDDELGSNANFNYWKKTSGSIRQTDLSFNKAIYIVSSDGEAINFTHDKCKKNDVYSSFFKHLVMDVSKNIASHSSSIKNSSTNENEDKALYTFNLYSDTVKSNILLKDKRLQKLWNHIKVSSIYMIKDNDEEEMILYPKHDFQSFNKYSYQSRPWWKSIENNPSPSNFGITAPYQDNDGSNDFNLIRTLWYKFEDQDENKSYYILFDLFVDSSEILSTQEQLILNGYYLCFVILFSIILFVFLIQMNFGQINRNLRGFNDLLNNMNSNSTINWILNRIGLRQDGD